MWSLQSFPRWRFFSGALALAALSTFPARSALADNYQYVFTGELSGTQNSLPFSNVLYTLTFDESTSAIDNHGGGVYTYDNVNGSLLAGAESFELTGLTLSANSGTDTVGFSNSGNTGGVSLTGAALAGYALNSPISIAQTSSGITTNAGGGVFSNTDGVALVLTADELLGFSATDLSTPPPPSSATPEPSSLLLLASGLPGLALLRRRFLKA